MKLLAVQSYVLHGPVDPIVMSCADRPLCVGVCTVSRWAG